MFWGHIRGIVRISGRLWCILIALVCFWAASRTVSADDGGFTFIQLSDLHIPAEDRDRAPAVLNLEIAVGEIAALNNLPDFIVVTGDIAADHGEAESYKKVRALLGKLSIPVHYARGNHDDHNNFNQYLLDGRPASADGQHYYYFLHKDYRFIVLDTMIPGEIAGRVGTKQLKWLRGVLKSDAGRPTFIFLHHHLKQLGDEEEYTLTDARALTQTVAKYSCVIAVLSGHVHRADETQRDGVWYLTTSAVSYPMGEGRVGYRVVELNNGVVRTVDRELGGEDESWLELK